MARWKEARGLSDGRSYGDLDEAEKAKFVALRGLGQLIHFEYNTFRDPQMKASSGELAVAAPRQHEVKDDPRLTRTREEADKRRRGFLKRPVRLLDQAGQEQRATLPQGAVCRVHVKDPGPAGKKASDYYWIREAPTADASYGRLEDFTPGFVKREDVITTALERDDTGLRYEKRHSPTQFPLFQGPPRVDDVRQVSLGDCYLLAAVLSLVRHDPSFFVEAMKDHGDGKVSVRLYDIQPGPPKTFRERIVHVEKSVAVRKAPATTLEEGYNKGATWVQILEKAYAAAGYTGSQPEAIPAKTMTISQIAGGFPQIALEHLTGQPATETVFETSTYGDKAVGKTWASTSEELQNFLNERDPSKKRFLAWFVNNGSVGFETALVELHKDHDEVRKDEVFALLDKHVSDDNLRRDVKDFIEHVKLYPGKRGSGEYTATQTTLFRTVAEAVEAHKRVVLSTRESMKRRGGSHTGRSAGEHRYQGLAGPHAYEVIDFRPTDFLHNPPQPGLLWVKLRNPWGKYGRTYKEKSTGENIVGGDTDLRTRGMKAVEAEAEAEFWVTLADVTKRFRTVTVQ